jgi:predicted kinase
MKTLTLLRGLPGSGKSTFAKSLGGEHIETDMFFVDRETGEYKFEATKLKLAHNWCAIQVQKAMVEDEPKIIVSNTFTQEWEMKTYYDLAKMHGYRVFSIIVENRHDGINEHNVPEEKLEQMKHRFQIKL